MRSIAGTAVALLTLAFCTACGGGPPAGDAQPVAESGNAPAPAALPTPSFHHIHVNSVNPARSLDWWAILWPAGERTTVAGLPAFAADGVYLLYNQVETRAPGAFDPARRQSVPQSAFWTTGPSTDGLALYERLTALDPGGERFGFLPVFTGPDDTEGVARSGLAPFGDQLLTVAEMAERAAREAADPPGERPGGQDFGYLVDPDGILVEFNGNADTEDLFHGHTHFWHEQPLCAANWYVEHLGMELPPRRDPDTGALTPRGLHDPCHVEIGDVSYPTFLPMGQLRRPNLDPVLAHLAAAGIPILEGPYPFGDTRAVLIEDLDGLALELVEAGF